MILESKPNIYLKSKENWVNCILTVDAIKVGVYIHIVPLQPKSIILHTA